MSGVVAVALLLALDVRPARAAQEAENRADPNSGEAAAIHAILQAGWQSGAEARGLAEETYELWQDSRTADVPLAYFANRMRHLRYREADEPAQRATNLAPQDFDAWYGRIWVALVQGEFDRGLVDMQSMAKQLAEAKQLAADRRREAFERLGRLYGFATGPGQNRSTPAVAETALAAILAAAADPADKAAFDAHRRQVLEQFDELVERRDTEVADHVERATQEQQQTLANLADQAAQLDQAQAQLADQRGAVEQEGLAKLDEIQSRAAPLERDAADLDSRFQLIQSTLLAIRNDIFFLESELAHEHDPHRRAFLISRIAGLSSQARSHEAELFYIESQLNQALAALNAVRAEWQSANDQLAAALAGLDGQLDAIQTERQRNAQLARRAARPPRARTGIIKSMSDAAVQLTTYDPFPAEQIRQRILERWP